MEFLTIICVGTAVYCGFLDENQVLRYFFLTAPSIFFSGSRSSLRGLFVFEETPLVYAVLYGSCFCLIASIIVAICLTWVSLKYLKKASVGNQTFIARTNLRERRLNKITLNIVIRQGWLAILFLLFPLLVSILLLLFRVPYGAQVTQIIMTLSSFYPFLDGLLIIYNIKPYRRFVILLFKKLFGPPQDSHRPGSPGGISVLSANY